MTHLLAIQNGSALFVLGNERFRVSEISHYRG
jgi:hypothetical protein